MIIPVLADVSACSQANIASIMKHHLHASACKSTQCLFHKHLSGSRHHLASHWAALALGMPIMTWFSLCRARKTSLLTAKDRTARPAGLTHQQQRHCSKWRMTWLQASSAGLASQRGVEPCCISLLHRPTPRRVRHTRHKCTPCFFAPHFVPLIAQSWGD